MRLLTAISLALIVLMAVACSSEPAPTVTPAPTVKPAPTPDVPLLDEETVVNITAMFAEERMHSLPPKTLSVASWKCGSADQADNFQAKYVGKDIWVVTQEGNETFCTFTVHDKEAHVILPQ